jgi:hypothetical protein
MRSCFPPRLNRARHQAQTSSTLNWDRLQVLLADRENDGVATGAGWTGAVEREGGEASGHLEGPVSLRCDKGGRAPLAISDIAVESARAKSLSLAERL